MKTIKAKVLYEVEIEVDETNNFVKNCESDNDLLMSLSVYQFTNIHPAIKSGDVRVCLMQPVEIS